MSRSEAIKWACAALLALGAATLVWGDAGGPAPAVPGASRDRDTGSHRPGAAPEPAGTPASKAAAALSAGRVQKGQGNLIQAETQFQKALDNAPRGSDIYKAALEELTYELPLMRVQRYVLAGEKSKAGALLQELLQEHKSDKKKSRHLVELIARLRKGALVQGGVYNQPGGGRRAIDGVERTLQRYFAKNGHYPRGYAELNRILPADRYPLNRYDIVHYVASGHAYGLTLRSKSDPENVLTVQNTGLVQ